ncbi:hypothetical protein [Pseudooceanicola sp.]|uniref:hypothetical protein n=1 Tax=Pseudooceanicola sp. TaxID=1914328 RepID=UPI00262F2509|nr:hypothetical protein [Pseudooceanicola sp.]MDF1854692.1 hypothetical protein [Pseudooceanicola sp.]
MKHKWIIDVLSDVRRYAVEHGLADVAAHIEAAAQAASSQTPRAEDRGENEGVADIANQRPKMRNFERG